MLCQNCNKNEANVRYTQIINGEKKEMFLCEKCSKELGINNINIPIDFSSFFGDLLQEYEAPNFIGLNGGLQELKCDNCNLTYNQFLDTGKIGCKKCYDTFSEKINPILKRIHGSNKYLGRNAKNVKSNILENIENHPIKEEKKESLEQKLKKAIEEERYEDAAKIRDEIKNNKEE